MTPDDDAYLMLVLIGPLVLAVVLVLLGSL